MAVNIFSFVLMGVILYIIYSEKYLKKIYIKSLTLLVLIEMYIECGNFIDLGEFQVSYASLVEVYFCLLSLLIIVYSKCGISRTLMSTILLLVFIMILGILFIFIGIQFFTTGIIIDMLMKTYFESQNKRPFNIRKITTFEKK